MTRSLVFISIELSGGETYKMLKYHASHLAAGSPEIIPSHIEKEANYLIDNGVYGLTNKFAQYNPSYIAFDKYERNTFTNNSVLAPYLYNGNDWDVYMQYVSGVAKYIGAKVNKTLPIMLFQIPGGHIPSSEEANWQYGETAPDYFLGNKAVCNPDDVLQSLRNGAFSGKTSNVYSSYNVDKFPTYMDYVYAPIQGVSYDNIHNGNCVYGSHMVQLVNADVFAILWGGGSTTSIAGPQDDKGFLSDKIISYMNAPYSLQGDVLPSQN